MEELISVIVPVYNTEIYLNRCVDSIIRQTYKNLEIILVDDGSTDRSGEICDTYAEKDKRVKVLHQKNSGPSVARNYGITIAQGDYIGFVDSDDYIEPDMYESLYRCMETGGDIVCCGSVSIYKHTKKVVAKTKKECTFNTEEALLELLRGELITFSVCDKLFRRQLMEKERFAIGRLCEDLPFTYQMIRKSNQVINIGEIKYHYFCNRDNSRSKATFTFRRLDYVFFMRDIYRDISNNFPQLLQVAEYRYILSINYIVNQIDNLPNKNEYLSELRRLKKVLKHMIFKILRNPYMDKEQKRYLIKSIR